MRKATAAVEPNSRSASGSPAVAPFIATAVGDVAYPSRVLAPIGDLRHLPGEGGALVGLRNVFAFATKGIEHFVENERRFGSVFRSQLALRQFVQVGDPELIAQITRNDDGAWSSPLAYMGAFEGVIAPGDGHYALPNLDFEAHRDARKLVQPAFSASATAIYLSAAMPLFESAIESWIARGRVDFKRAVRSLLARVSTLTFLGMKDDREASVIERATSDMWGALIALVKNRWVSTRHRRAIHACARLAAILRPLVAERRAGNGEDLFSRLCAETRGDSGLSDEDVVGLFVGILLAAFDTTACALTSMTYLLARNLDWQGRLRDEATSVGSARISYEDTKRLEATDRAWKETHRLMPVAFAVPRRALRDVELGGWPIPAGALVQATLPVAMRNGRWWSHPERFDPDRFSAERGEDRKHKGLFLPFGAGPHACLGMHLATVEAKAFCHAMLTRCRFRLERDYEAAHTFTPLGVVSGEVALVLDRNV